MNQRARQGRIGRRAILCGIAGSAGATFLIACGGRRGGNATATGTNNAFATVAPGKQIAVAATTTQIQDFVTNVGGNRVIVAGILKPNVDPHAYEPTVEDANVIAKADIVFVHGIGLDSWMDKTIKGASVKAPVTTTTDGITALKGDENEPEGDPHVWFDPTLVQTMVTNIANGLAKIDPVNANAYQTNAKSYTDQLTHLDGQLMGIFNQIPKEQRKLVTNHDAFRYLANRYSLTIVGAVIPSLSDTAEPSAKQINDLIDTIKKENVKAIFAESSANPKVARQVAQETGIAIIDTLYGDTLGEPGSAGDTYLKMMAYDATTIANGLK
jgi:zinc/manganese transport system substrate-binding protein/manganese/iron transport system substrate-binding protein